MQCYKIQVGTCKKPVWRMHSNPPALPFFNNLPALSHLLPFCHFPPYCLSFFIFNLSCLGFSLLPFLSLPSLSFQFFSLLYVFLVLFSDYLPFYFPSPYPLTYPPLFRPHPFSVNLPYSFSVSLSPLFLSPSLMIPKGYQSPVWGG